MFVCTHSKSQPPGYWDAASFDECIWYEQHQQRSLPTGRNRERVPGVRSRPPPLLTARGARLLDASIPSGPCWAFHFFRKMGDFISEDRVRPGRGNLTYTTLSSSFYSFEIRNIAQHRPDRCSSLKVQSNNAFILGRPPPPSRWECICCVTLHLAPLMPVYLLV